MNKENNTLGADELLYLLMATINAYHASHKADVVAYDSNHNVYKLKDIKIVSSTLIAIEIE